MLKKMNEAMALQTAS